MKILKHLAVLTIMLVFAHTLWGQAGTTGTILGTVTDTTGAVISGAPVEITNTSTGVSTKVTSTGTGDYTATNLIPGQYKVAVQMAGFSKTQVTGIILVVAQDQRVNLQLKAGAVSETIEVSASAVALDTDSSSISQIVTEHQMSQLPINGRNFTALLFVGAGAVQQSGEQGQMRSNEGNAISINGSRPESNNYTLDGLMNTDTALSTPAVILSQDAIQEFKVQSATYGAEYGFSANQVNIVSKSGGNQYHGSTFEFLRNDYMNAIPHQTINNHSTKATEWRDNQFGYVLNGPITIPKLYNGHDRTFFLANYEGRRAILGGHTSGAAPTAAELGGDFSALAALPTYDPTITLTTDPRWATSCAKRLADNLNCRPLDPVTGLPLTTIASSRFSRLAKVTAKTIPTAATDDSSGTVNWQATANSTTDTDQQTYRVDQTFQKWGQIFFRYTKADYASSNYATASLAAQANAGKNIFSENSKSWTGAYTVALPHGFVNDFRFGKLEAKALQSDSPASTADITNLGLTGVFTNLPSYAAGYPNLGFGTVNAVGAGSPGNNPTTSDIPVWEFADSVMKQWGAHSFKFGFDYRSWVQKRNLATNFLGNFGFTSSLIKGNGTGGVNG
ncbi:MAG: carboxypeptidase-like regulatory domain-containing protein, partial [Formivibrio sp.]|nr:carboxypeptidase-like regulatory domain-containing protein [Formivibrio sp.]